MPKVDFRKYVSSYDQQCSVEVCRTQIKKGDPIYWTPPPVAFRNGKKVPGTVYCQICGVQHFEPETLSTPIGRPLEIDNAPVAPTPVVASPIVSFSDRTTVVEDSTAARFGNLFDDGPAVITKPAEVVPQTVTDSKPIEVKPNKVSYAIPLANGECFCSLLRVPKGNCGYCVAKSLEK